MRLRILVMESDGEHIALVKQDDEELRAAKVGSGPSPRAAVQDAVNAYFAGQTEPLLDPSEVVEANPVEPSLGMGWIRAARTPGSIRALLEQAAADSEVKVRFQYEDASGNRMVRTVLPSKVEDRRRGAGFKTAYLIAFDQDRDDMRTFLLDRIEWVEVVA